MGTSVKINENKDTIIWIDKNALNQENKETYKYYLKVLENFNFFSFKSIKEVISLLEKNLKYFEFRLFYIVVSGSLAEAFYNEYVKITEKYNIIASTIVYSYNQKYHETKPYFKDKFLNSGGVTSDFEYVLYYILKDESGWRYIKQKYKEYTPDKAQFGDTFINVDTNKEYELALPILIGKTINSSMIEEGGIKKFQNLLLSRYCLSYPDSILTYIFPSKNKNMEIPLHLLTKFFLKFYTAESLDDVNNFYRHLNQDLSNGKFEDYHPFIFLIYDCLNKGFIKSYRKKLYRGTKISKKELDRIISNNNKHEKILYYSKNFLSFSKDEKQAKNFLSNGNKDTECILFVLDECKEEKFFDSNVDIENISCIQTEKEVLMLPLTCFEIIKIGEEEIYKNNNGIFKYRKIYLNYLDKYYEKIILKINELNYKKDKDGNKDSKEIDKFFSKAMNSKFGKIAQNCYEKKNNLSINFCKMIKASPDNNFFYSIIGINFFSKIIGQSSEQIGAHLDDEIPNFIDDYYEYFEYSEDDVVIEENKTIKFFERFSDEFKNLDIKTLDNSYSIGYCLGCFLTNFESFSKAPTISKAFSLASLALGCGLPLIKLIPKIKSIIGVKLLNSSLNVGMVLNGLNILWSVGVGLFSIFKFHYDHHKRWKITLYYTGKMVLKIGISIGISIIGNLTNKSITLGIAIFTGTCLGPFATVALGLLGGIGFGVLGNKIGNKITDKVFGKDEFILSSANLYYKYIPEKYRKKGNNPHLKWNKTYLCSNVKSYIIECIVNDFDTVMRVMNIPNNIFELEECLGYSINPNYTNNDIESDISTDDEEEGKKFILKKITKDKKYAGDLVIPYKGISENAYKIDFVIYGIGKERISSKEWQDYRDKESKEKLIKIGFVLSVY